MSTEKCFLCSKDANNNKFAYIDKCVLPSSKNTVRLVLLHLGRCKQKEFKFSAEDWVCEPCVDTLTSYDQLMVNLMSSNTVLKDKLKTAKKQELLRQCFLCASKCYQNTSRNIDKCVMPASKQVARKILQYLAKCINKELKLRGIECLCLDCTHLLVQYDKYTVTLLAAQNKLTQQLSKALSLRTVEDVKLEEAVTAADNEATNAMSMQETDEENDADSTSSSDEKHECNTCFEVYDTRQDLRKHIAETHKTKTSFMCKICGESRRDQEYLDLHMNVHVGKTEMECRYCPKKFTRRVNTLRHMRMHWDKKSYQCEKCGACFSLDNMLYNHMLIHEAEENPIICNICNQSFKSKRTYGHHMVTHQENRPRHACELCGKSFTERYTLKMHMRTHERNMDMDQAEVSPAQEVVIVHSEIDGESNLFTIAQAVDMLEAAEVEIEHAEENIVINEAQAEEESVDEDGDFILKTEYTVEDCCDVEECVVQEEYIGDPTSECIICNHKFNNKPELEEHLQIAHDVILQN